MVNTSNETRGALLHLPGTCWDLQVVLPVDAGSGNRRAQPEAAP